MQKPRDQNNSQFRITAGANNVKRWGSVIQPPCLQGQSISFKEIVYDNRVLNIRKKFTIPTEPSHYTPKKQFQGQISNPEPHFRKFIDSIVKNKALCRRGPCDVPFPTEKPCLAMMKVKRLKTDSGLDNNNLEERYKSQRVVTQMSKKTISKKSLANMKTCQDSTKQLPQLKIRTERLGKGDQQQWRPIRVQRFVTKGVRRRGNISQRDSQKQKKNILTRKLDVQLLNYLLLTKQTSYFL